MPRFALDLKSLSADLNSLITRSSVPVGSTHVAADFSPLSNIGTSDLTNDELDRLLNLKYANEIRGAVEVVADSYQDVSDVTSLDLSQTKYRLRDYQIDGIRFLKQRHKAFLTDKPGLGKTIQAICAASGPTIVFAPTYLTYNWYNVLSDIMKHNGGTDKVRCAAGPRAVRQAIIDSCTANDVGKPLTKWLICNIEMLRDYEFPLDHFETVIIDEAHHLRGHGSKQSLGAIALAEHATNVFLLSATPIYNKPDDLYGQLRLLDRERFHSYWQFRDRYTVQIDMPFGPKVIGARASLRPLFESYNLGRTYGDVQMQLPELLTDVIRIDPPEDFKKLYRTLKEQYYIPGQEVYSNALQVLQHLRKLTGPQKLKPLLSLLADTDALEGTVIFSWYKETAESIAELLSIPCVTGDMPPKERFEVAKSGTCISATISSMAEGVDLSHLHTVVFFELDYVPGRLYQALSRVRRHGGHDVVKVIYLLVKNTVDEVLYNVDATRTVTINEIVRECLT